MSNLTKKNRRAIYARMARWFNPLIIFIKKKTMGNASSNKIKPAIFYSQPEAVEDARVRNQKIQAWEILAYERLGYCNKKGMKIGAESWFYIN